MMHEGRRRYYSSNFTFMLSHKEGRDNNLSAKRTGLNIKLNELIRLFSTQFNALVIHLQYTLKKLIISKYYFKTQFLLLSKTPLSKLNRKVLNFFLCKSSKMPSPLIKIILRKLSHILSHLKPRRGAAPRRRCKLKRRLKLSRYHCAP